MRDIILILTGPPAKKRSGEIQGELVGNDEKLTLEIIVVFSRKHIGKLVSF